MKRAQISWLMVLPFSFSANFAASDLVLGPSKGDQYDRPDSVSTLVSSKGQSTTPSSPPNTVDTQPPTIQIEAPPVVPSGGQAIIRVNASDDLGLFQIGSEPIEPAYFDCDEGCEDKRLYAGERDATIEYTVDLWGAFGQDVIIGAYVSDLAGNSATTTSTIYSEEQIQAGRYTLETPLNEEISGQGCYLDQGTQTFTVNAIYVQGYYSDACDSRDPSEQPNPHACLNIFTYPESQYGGWGRVTIAMTSPSDTNFMKTQQNMYVGNRDNPDASNYTYIEIEFINSSPPAVQASLTLRCEDKTYGNAEWGPFMMYGVLED